jgi:hypothetical protein
MTGLTTTDWRARFLLTGFAAALALIALATLSPRAQARVWVSVGVPFPGYGYGPYYDYPPPGYYPPPPGYYPPPPGGYAPPGAPAPSAYTPGAPAPGYAPPAGGAAAPASGPQITYTSRPPFTNSAGQTCREYKTTDPSAGRDVYGTACRQADGQWRVVN